VRINRHKNRLWVYYKGHHNLLGIEWNFFRKATHCGIETGWRKKAGRRSQQFFIGIPWMFNLWVHLFDCQEWADYELGIKIHDGSIWFSIFSNPIESSSRDPWYRKTHCFTPLDFLLGREKCTTEIIGTEAVEIPMPERSYSGIAKIEVRTWKRPRWHWPTVRKSVWIDVEGGIPFPGKGENSWDCGMDGIWGTGHEGHVVEGAIGRYVGAVLNNRRRYGGKNWKLPEDYKKTA
jgi:hypothetical protein